MDIAAVVVVLTCFLDLFLGFFVLLRNPRARLGQSFFAMTIFTSAWAVTNYYTDYASTFKFNILFNRLAYLFAFLGIVMCVMFTYYFATPTKRYPKNILAIYFFVITVVASLSATNYIAGTVEKTGTKLHFMTGTLIPLYFVVLLIMLGTIIWSLYSLIRHGTSLQKNQSKTILIFFTTSLVLAMLTNLVIPALSDNNFAAAKLGPPLLTLLFTSSVSYSIVSKKLFDIQFVIVRALAYSLLLVALSAFYVLGALTIGGILFQNQSTNIAQEAYNVALVLVLAYTFQPLRRFFEKVTDSIFYRDRYDPQTLLNDLGGIMSREIELEHLTSMVIDKLTTQMRLSKALILVLENNSVFYEANAESIDLRNISLQELEQLKIGVMVKDTLEPGSVPEIFSKYDLSVSVDLRSSNELVGFLLLGQKKSGDIFNSNDVKTLSILAHELAIAIHNAKSYTQIQNFNRTLQKRIDDATVQLRDANNNLKKLDGIKNEFLSMATHQLNTPLSVIDGYLSMIIDNANTRNDIPVDDREFLQKSLHRVHLMKRLVTDFLNVSRIESGTFAIEAEPVDMNRLVTEEVSTLGLAAKERQVQLHYFAPHHPVPIIEIDEQKTRQAVMNLIDNAIYYTPKGEVKVSLESDGQNVTFKVTDNGIGVPEDQKSKLFQKFSRATNAVKERPSGTGVGLFLVKRVVEDQGGSIIFNSTLGHGSTFGFSLPIKKEEEKAEA